MSDQVLLRCIRQGSKLRVHIASPGYLSTANCQFPRAIREEGRSYLVPASSIRVGNSKNGVYFYRISQPITIVGGEATPAVSSAAPVDATPVSGRRPKKRKQAPQPVVTDKPAKVFDVEEEPECVVCLEAKKERICVPCGHYCMCAGCVQLLVTPKKCPMCRTAIRTTISPDEL
ncbi:hypothetical protein Poli38472_005812 [Pythium oligandrum]|uniref:RING-type domain-containing protein n=1 Tax=Pythium oligandrum TaxID=41045 RepID=A0A8K1CSC0_PYTOL|nr:hypothetical protein Poli38472_005812 [Pythium oligandrum]|eukprot:TMW68344.1 hypothetical protein Poli38472_005812 [Pythium oligandrum]